MVLFFAEKVLPNGGDEMHIPDGFLDLGITLLCAVVSAVFIGIGLIQAKRYMDERHVPLMAILTAGVFAAQLLNFPIIGGTSGHLVGGTLLAVFLGPLGALISMTIILTLQALLFGDGGMTALGANILNMGVIGGILGYYVYILVRRLVGKGGWGVRLGAAIGSYVSIVLGAVACGVEIGASSLFPFPIWVTVPAMTGWHLVIGVGEALITVAVIEYVLRARPDMLALPKIGFSGLLRKFKGEELEKAEREELEAVTGRRV
ncbi:MAG: energy-coupling factor ABC transporter permease [Candidatus Jordarchaeales archaeon]